MEKFRSDFFNNPKPGYQQVYEQFSTGFMGKMLISSSSCENLKIKLKSREDIYCTGLYLSARWMVLSQVVPRGVQFIILPDKDNAEYCAADLYNLLEGDVVFYLPSSGKGIERSNYKSTLGVQRTAAIEKLISHDPSSLLVIVTYPEAIEEGIPSRENIASSILTLKKGDEISYDDILNTLGSKGFEKVDFVSAPGQFALRGSVVDIFSYSSSDPYRFSLWGNEIEEIHFFDCNTQLSKDALEKAEIVSSTVSEGESEISVAGILPADTNIWLDSSDMYSHREFFADYSSFRKIFLEMPISSPVENPLKFSIAPQPVFNKNFDLLSTDIRSKIEQGYSILIYGEKESQLERLKSILYQSGSLMPEFVKGKNLHAGFIDSENKVCCYTDHEIFNRYHRVSIRRSVDKSEQLTLNELSSFNIGDYVVHIDHGVGVFGGLVRMRDDHDRVREVVKLIYKDNDIVFVSVHSLNKISRYRSKDGEVPKINKLGSKAWSNLKSNAKSKVKDIAKDLIQLYAKRKASKGFAFSADTYMQEELESSFMYEDTPDQEAATRAVKMDMEDSCPMDRLVCGDVGFGKTEIAIRAAFKAVADGKQVAVLVPTTILALQHYNTFCARLKDFPCTIDYVSRLRTAGEVKHIQEDLASGKTEIVIGTHKILGNGFNFKDLGLLIIDEEQKFGVAAKERLRQMKMSVDTLTLTATPIPRTLQFSLLGARDLSIISTPPPNRIPVQTEIILFDEKEVKGIINYELNRGGQVFFLHNRVEELQSIYEILHRLVPDAKICITHGRMEAGILEKRMLEFIRGDYDILLSTTIIENGLDIPNANTIIINQAQNIGLSDLHQLRGRVGRSNKKAFCYLIVPPLVSISDDARRRLKAIEEFSDLGSGFNIAMQDLDIRGAGNLLGAEQSGFIMDMGYETYQKVISEALEELGVEAGLSNVTTRNSLVDDCTIETDQPAMIPDDYIDVQAEKIRIYKQLDSMVNDKEIDRLYKQIEDRFGRIPQELENLFTVVKLRNLGSSLGFEKIIFKNSLFILFFINNSQSSYYKSETFTKILSRLADVPKFEMKQTDKLKLVARGVESLDNALELLRKLR